jgi:hypothetical protein
MPSSHYFSIIANTAFSCQAKRKEIPERELQLDNAVICVGQLGEQLDETTVGSAQDNVNDMKDRWGVVTQRLDDFCNRDIPVSINDWNLMLKI